MAEFAEIAFRFGLTLADPEVGRNHKVCRRMSIPVFAQLVEVRHPRRLHAE